MRGQNWIDRLQRTAIKEEIMKQKGFKCEDCGTSRNLTVHHKKKISQHPELEFELDNVMVLCEPCHIKLHKKEIKH